MMKRKYRIYRVSPPRGLGPDYYQVYRLWFGFLRTRTDRTSFARFEDALQYVADKENGPPRPVVVYETGRLRDLL